MSKLEYVSQLDFPNYLTNGGGYLRAYNYAKTKPKGWLEDAGGLACPVHGVDWIRFNVLPIDNSGEYFSPEVFISPENSISQHHKSFTAPIIRAVQFAEKIILAGAFVASKNEEDNTQDGLLFTIYLSNEYNMGDSQKALVGIDFWYYPQENCWVIQEHDGEFEIRGAKGQEIINLLVENYYYFSDL